jgi:hypothetical protein
MKGLFRKDMVFLWVMFFSFLFMLVSQPDNEGARTVVWNFSFLLILIGSIFWVTSELLDWVIGQKNAEITAISTKGMTRGGMIAVAERMGQSSKDDLSGFSDEDLAALIISGSNSVVSRSAPASLNEIISGILRLFVKALKCLNFAVVAAVKFSRKSDIDRKNDVVVLTNKIKSEIGKV